MVESAVVKTEPSLSLIAFMCSSPVNKDKFMIVKLYKKYTEYCITGRK